VGTVVAGGVVSRLHHEAGGVPAPFGSFVPSVRRRRGQECLHWSLCGAPASRLIWNKSRDDFRQMAAAVISVRGCGWAALCWRCARLLGRLPLSANPFLLFTIRLNKIDIIRQGYARVWPSIPPPPRGHMHVCSPWSLMIAALFLSYQSPFFFPLHKRDLYEYIPRFFPPKLPSSVPAGQVPTPPQYPTQSPLGWLPPSPPVIAMMMMMMMMMTMTVRRRLRPCHVTSCSSLLGHVAEDPLRGDGLGALERQAQRAVPETLPSYRRHPTSVGVSVSVVLTVIIIIIIIVSTVNVNSVIIIIIITIIIITLITCESAPSARDTPKRTV
jgi:hypothetical protein